jgi:hypothetical protein
MVQIEVNSKFFEECPSLSEIEPSMDNIAPDELIEAKWGNSKPEREVLNRHKNRQFKLYVSDLPAKERATATLELPLNLDANLVGNGRVALVNRKLYNWREFTRNVGPAVSKHILLKIAADEIRNGNKPKLAYIVKDVFLDGVTPGNVDTLLRLRILRGY